MIHAYNDYYFEILQDKLANMCEIATYSFNVNLDEFFKLFINSKYCKYFENPSFEILGISSNDIVMDLLNQNKEINQDDYATPEYWVGWVMAYANYEFNIPYTRLINRFKPSILLAYYPTYHEMDISQILDVFKKKLDLENPLKEYRTKMGLSQSDLAALSGVPIRNIKAYEQGSLDISKAQINTVYALSKALKCKIDDLIHYN